MFGEHSEVDMSGWRRILSLCHVGVVTRFQEGGNTNFALIHRFSKPRIHRGSWPPGYFGLPGVDLVQAGFERPGFSVEDKASGKSAGQGDGCVQLIALAAILDLDCALRMRITCCE